MAKRDATPHILKLPAVLDLNAASRLHEQVLALKDKNVAVDASDVARIGTQCIQILLSAARSWRSMDMTFSVNQSSDAFAKTLQLLGITDEEMIPMEIVQ
jgi:chemotaxis protein CheX